jgi:hypothetical protein
MEGAIDIHVHFGPDPRVERRADALEMAQRAKEMGMRGMVLKSHEYPTMPVAHTVGRVVPGLALVGAISLDIEVGGLNPVAVEASAKMGAKVVWMPTLSSAADRRRRGLEGGTSILDDKGRLLPVVYTILETIRRYDMVLATGHLSPQETLTLVEEARNLGIGRIVVTHASTLNRWVGLSVEDMKALARMGAFIEHCVHVMMPLTEKMPPEELIEMIKAVGVEQCILSTDFGQAFHPIPPEGLRMGIATLLRCGLEEVEIGMMVKDNPSRLLGL